MCDDGWCDPVLLHTVSYIDVNNLFMSAGNFGGRGVFCSLITAQHPVYFTVQGVFM